MSWRSVGLLTLWKIYGVKGSTEIEYDVKIKRLY